MARKDAPANERENVRAKSKDKARGDVLVHVSCARDLTGLVTVLHIMVERAGVLTHSARGKRIHHRFDKLIWKATSMTASQVQVLLQSRFHLCRILPVLTSTESSSSILETMSKGGVDSLRRIQEMHAQAGLPLTSHPVSPLRFSFANGQEDVSTSVLPAPYLPWKVYIRVLNAPGPVLLGADVREDLGLVVDHVDCSVFLSHLKLESTLLSGCRVDTSP